MTTGRFTRCDRCRKVSYEDPASGWLHVAVRRSLPLSHVPWAKTLDLCSWRCLADFAASNGCFDLAPLRGATTNASAGGDT